MKRFYFIFGIGLFLSSSLVHAQQYVETSLRAGEGMIELFRRYHLPNTSAMQQKFRALNNMSSASIMARDRRYRLPISRYRYNGKSIRSTLKIQSYLRAERIANYNHVLRREGVRTDDFTISLDLWVPFHEWQERDALRLVSATESRPRSTSQTTAPVRSTPRPASTTTSTTPKPTRIEDNRIKLEGRGTHKVFGEKYQRVRLLDRRLQGFVYYIDAGHGGPDPGTNTTYQGRTINEDEYAYDIALRLARRLVLHGATVFLTVRDENDGIRDGWFLENDREEVFGTGAPITGDLAQRLIPRSEFANERFDAFAPSAVAQRFISIHVDGREGELTYESLDVSFLYHSQSAEGAQLSRIFLDTFRQNYARDNRGYAGKMVARDNLHVLKAVKAPSILVETGNIRSANDQARILNPANRQTLAEWLCDGLLREAKTIMAQR